ncbi:MAG: hypothetical protein D6775_02610 [Caldilineae bacterium]|nr:MAG: hypothetical protein D6775_02610 [Caldilineae bacterium]
MSSRDSELEKRKEYRTGLIVLIALIVLEVFDWLTAIFLNGSVWVLFVLALINAALIVQYYMHIGALFSDEGGH